MKILTIIGARPQFIKAAPMVRALEGRVLSHKLVHTGQHYDYEMSKIFFDELGLPEPDYHLGVGSGSHGLQTGEILKLAEAVLVKEKPDWVMVFGDTNSTLAGALAAAKLHIPVAHIEAGLRSYNKRMPEEINRVLTDHIASLLCCPVENAVANLKAEGFSNIINQGRLIPEAAGNAAFRDLNCSLSNPAVVNTGDVMYDAYLFCQGIASQKSKILQRLELQPQNYFLATVHRAENTDNLKALTNIVDALIELSKECHIIWPLHPRTRKNLEYYSLFSRVEHAANLKILPPLGYFDMLLLERDAAIILTDSGGVQKEAFFAGVPCITLREETEWIELVEIGHNSLVSTKAGPIDLVGVVRNNRGFNPKDSFALYGDGKTSHKIIRLLTYSFLKT